MQTNLLIPDKIKVGYQKRDGTYTGKLAYVIYYDHKGVLRKEKSWQSWRHDSIEPEEFENVPTEGFVLNKKVGGYSTGWNHRSTYCRIYDPRGFEVEITIENLLYILEFNDSIKGKGLTGEYVYSWDGKDLLLLPISSPEYKQISDFNKILKDKSYLKSKDIKVGFDYKTKQGKTWTYLGRFDYYEPYGRYNGHIDASDFGKKKGKKYYFCSGKYRSDSKKFIFQNLSSLGDKILEEVSDQLNPEYAEMFEGLEAECCYSPFDESKTEYKPYTVCEFVEKLKKDPHSKIRFYSDVKNLNVFRIAQHKRPKRDAKPNHYGHYFYSDYEDVEGIYQVDPLVQYNRNYGWTNTQWEFSEKNPVFAGSIEEIFKKFIPLYKNEYLENGKLYRSMVVDIPR